MPEVLGRASRVLVFSGSPPTDCGNDKLRNFVAGAIIRPVIILPLSIVFTWHVQRHLLLVLDSFDIRTQFYEFVLYLFVAAIEVVDPLYGRLPFGCESCNDKGRTGPQVCSH